MENKQKLRQKMIAYREQLSREWIERASARICHQLIQLPAFRHAKTILFYMAIKNEVDVSQAMRVAWQEGKRVVLPRVNGSNMDCLEVNPQDELQKGNWGIPEPKNGKVIDPDQSDWVIVPGVAFDRKGYRLGYGGGYYDRFFSKYPHLQRVGVLEHGQLVPTVYPESHDQPLQQLVTSQQVFQIQKSD